MRRIILLAAIVVGLAGFSTADAFSATRAERDLDWVLDTETPTDHIGGRVFTTCSAGPAQTCTTGTHLRLNAAGPVTGGYISHGFAGVSLAGVTATLESKVIGESSGNARTFRCNVLNGAISCLGGFGLFPSGEFYTQECRSYNYGTTTPGGIGQWSCGITESSSDTIPAAVVVPVPNV